MIAVKRFVALEKVARAALKRGDLKTIATINQDEELASANAIFIVRDGELYVGVRDQIQEREVEQNQ